MNNIVVGEKFLYFGFTLKSFFTEVMVIIPTPGHCHGLLGEPDHLMAVLTLMTLMVRV